MGQRRLFRSCFSKESILRVEEKERHLIKMARFTNFLLLTVCSPLIFGKPQYGGAPVQTPVSAPVVQAPSQISCFTTQETIWDTQYIEKTEKQCHQEQIQQFRQACQTVYKNSCQTVNKQVCSQQYRQESQPYTETECSSQQKTDCESRWEEAVVGSCLRGRPAVGVAAATGQDQAATSLCSQGLLVPTLGQMLRAPLKPGQVAMPSTLVELVKSFNLFENTFD